MSTTLEDAYVELQLQRDVDAFLRQPPLPEPEPACHEDCQRCVQRARCWCWVESRYPNDPTR